MGNVVVKTVQRRRARRRWEEYEATRTAPSTTFEAAVFFADSPVNLYQIQQWYEPMRRLNEVHPVAVIVRNVQTALALKDECPLPVVHLETIAETEPWLANQRVGAVFYVNQNILNFRMMRFRDPAHIFISHGESDKDYMASNQLKAYDYTFIAGQAAEDRLSRRLVDFDHDKHLRRIGRPQIDVIPAGPTLPDDGRTVVLYAPTWEGDRPSMTYSSLRSHAPAMLDTLLSTGTHRVIYRPHPRTGAFDPEFRTHHDHIVHQLKTANAADPTAQHMVDTDSTFGWQLAAADVGVADISAVAFDFLATGKPLLLTEPATPGAEVDEAGLASLIRTFKAAEAPDILQVIADVSSGEDRARYAEIVEHYFGDTTPGASLERFLSVSDEIIQARQHV